jgi:diacylglycerol kinase
MLRFIQLRIKSFTYAFKGLVDLFSNHPNAQVHLAVLLAATVLGVTLDISRMEWIILLLCFASVISMEAMNSAVEYLADRISREQDPLIGKAKDIAAAAVLWSSIGTFIIGLLIFLPKLGII